MVTRVVAGETSGQITLAGSADELRDNPQIRRAYLGR